MKHQRILLATLLLPLFAANLTHAMESKPNILFILAAGREYAQVLAPAIKEAPRPYEKLPAPVLVIRQRGEAWNHPFAVIYEPFFEKSESVQSVKALGGPANFVGFQVTSQIQGRVSMQYILVLPAATSVFEDPKLGIALRGRYAVIHLNERGECTALYLGEGSRLAFKGLEIASLDGAGTAANAEIKGDGVTFTANAPAQLTLPDGKRMLSAGHRNLQ